MAELTRGSLSALLEGKNQKQRMAVKSDEIIKVVHAQLPARNEVRLRGLDVKFINPPTLIRNKAGEVIGVDAFVNVFQNGVELQVDPHRVCINPPTQIKIPLEQSTGDDVIVYESLLEGDTGEPKPIHALRVDPWRAYQNWLVESLETTPNVKGFRTRGTVTTVYAATTDGSAYGYSTSYATARTTKYGNSGSLGIGQSRGTGPVSYLCTEGLCEFDTSAIGDDIVSQVDLMLDGSSDESTLNEFTAEVRDYDWSSVNWISGANLGNYTLLATWESTSYVAGYNTFTEEGTNFRDAIAGNGTTYIHISSSRHRIGNQPAATGTERVYFSQAETAGTDADPKLVITHSAPLYTGLLDELFFRKGSLFSSEEIAALYGDGTPPSRPFTGILPT